MSYQSFLVELVALTGAEAEKTAPKLTQGEERRQALEFAALGAASGPVLSGVSNYVQHGRPSPSSTSAKRWLGATMLTGAIGGGVMPIVRHHLERRTQERARERVRASNS